LQLDARVVVIFSVSEVYQIVEDSQFEVAFIIQLGEVTGPILQAASGQFCRVVPLDVKRVEDVGILFQRILFSSLLKEDKDMFGVFVAGCY